MLVQFSNAISALRDRPYFLPSGTTSSILHTPFLSDATAFWIIIFFLSILDSLRFTEALQYCFYINSLVYLTWICASICGSVFTILFLSFITEWVFFSITNSYLSHFYYIYFSWCSLLQFHYHPYQQLPKLVAFLWWKTNHTRFHTFGL